MSRLCFGRKVHVQIILPLLGSSSTSRTHSAVSTGKYCGNYYVITASLISTSPLYRRPTTTAAPDSSTMESFRNRSGCSPECARDVCCHPFCPILAGARATATAAPDSSTMGSFRNWSGCSPKCARDVCCHPFCLILAGHWLDKGTDDRETSPWHTVDPRDLPGDLDFADDVALLSHNQQDMHSKQANSEGNDLSEGCS